MNYKVSQKDDCIGEFKIFTYLLDKNIDEEFLYKIEGFGPLKIYKSFPKPFFHIKSSKLLLKGILGQNTIEVTYFDYEDLLLKNEFENELNKI